MSPCSCMCTDYRAFHVPHPPEEGMTIFVRSKSRASSCAGDRRSKLLETRSLGALCTVGTLDDEGNSMPCFISPVEDQRCLRLSLEGEIRPRDLAVMGYEARRRAKARHWSRIVVDMTQLQSSLTPPQLLDLAEILAGQAGRRGRLAFVGRPDHTRQVGWAADVARRSGLCLAYFRDPEKAARWMRPALAPARTKLELA